MTNDQTTICPTPAPTVTVTMTLGQRPGRTRPSNLPSSAPTSPLAHSAGRVPRIARLMALAIRFDDLLRKGEVNDYAELARLGHVTRARVTQIMNLLNLAPDIQEQLLFLPQVERGRDPVKEWMVRPVAAFPSWRSQREAFQEIGQLQDSQNKIGLPSARRMTVN